MQDKSQMKQVDGYFDILGSFPEEYENQYCITTIICIHYSLKKCNKCLIIFDTWEDKTMIYSC